MSLYWVWSLAKIKWFTVRTLTFLANWTVEDKHWQHRKEILPQEFHWWFTTWTVNYGGTLCWLFYAFCVPHLKSIGHAKRAEHPAVKKKIKCSLNDMRNICIVFTFMLLIISLIVDFSCGKSFLLRHDKSCKMIWWCQNQDSMLQWKDIYWWDFHWWLVIWWKEQFARYHLQITSQIINEIMLVQLHWCFWHKLRMIWHKKQDLYSLSAYHKLPVKRGLKRISVMMWHEL